MLSPQNIHSPVFRHVGTLGLKILIASLVPTHPTTVGNRARILQLCSALQALGHEVHFAYAPMEEGSIESMKQYFGERLHIADYCPTPVLSNPVNKLIRRIQAKCKLNGGYTYGIDDWYDPALDAFFKKLASTLHVDVVITEYAFLSRALNCFSDTTVKIIDTHDRFSDRYKIFLAAGKKPGWFSTTLHDEMKGLQRADIVIAIQQQEQEFFAQHLPNQYVLTVGHIAPTSEAITDWSDRIENSVVMVGIDSTPNNVAVRYLLDKVMPKVRLQIPNAVVLLAGSVCNTVTAEPGLRKLGVVKDIAQVYRQGWVAVNPVSIGSGQSIKSVEALGYSLPLVTTSTGARGLNIVPSSAFVEVADQDAEGMAQTIFQLLSNIESRTAASLAAVDFAYQWNELAIFKLEQLLQQMVIKKRDHSQLEKNC